MRPHEKAQTRITLNKEIVELRLTLREKLRRMGLDDNQTQVIMRDVGQIEQNGFRLGWNEAQ